MVIIRIRAHVNFQKKNLRLILAIRTNYDRILPLNVVFLFRLLVNTADRHSHIAPCWIPTSSTDHAVFVVAHALRALNLMMAHRLEHRSPFKTHLADCSQEYVVESKEIVEGVFLLGFSYEKETNKLRAFSKKVFRCYKSLLNARVNPGMGFILAKLVTSPMVQSSTRPLSSFSISCSL